MKGHYTDIYDNARSHKNNLLRYLTGKAYVDNDQTIEILMSDLEEEAMKIFFKSNTATAELATKVSIFLR